MDINQIIQALNLQSVSPVTEQALCDILTEEEKVSAINWAISREKIRYHRSMLEKGSNPQSIEEKIKNIDFSKRINIEKILQQANQIKHWRVEDEELKKKKQEIRIQEYEDLRKECNANYFFKLIRQFFINRNGNFIFNNGHRLYITAICYFLANDARFETELGYSFRKGLLVKGGAGIGKTRTLEAVLRNKLVPMQLFSILEITDRVKKEGECLLNTFGKVTILDDIGTEETPIKFYGTQINWFEEFILKYHLTDINFNHLIITTNLGGEEIENKYGYRVRSRLREMFNEIYIIGNDLRK
jgi:hypothetical protein